MSYGHILFVEVVENREQGSWKALGQGIGAIYSVFFQGSEQYDLVVQDYIIQIWSRQQRATGNSLEITIKLLIDLR